MRPHYLSWCLHLLLSTAAITAAQSSLAAMSNNTSSTAITSPSTIDGTQSNNPTTQQLPHTTVDTIVVTSSSGGITPNVNQQAIEKSTIVDMKDILKDQPSLSVSGGNGVSQQLYIRNFGENDLTFSVDDVATNAQIFHHQSRFMFDPALLRSMNIEKGTGQANSGFGVTAGAVRMTTVNANDMLRKGQNAGAMLGGGYSSNKGYHGVAAAYGRSGVNPSGSQFDAIVMGNYVKHDNYKDGDGDEVPNTKMDQAAYMAKFGWDINRDHRLEISQRREQTEGNLGFRPNLVGDFRGQPVLDTKITQDTTNLEYQGYDLAGKHNLNASANVYYSQIQDTRKQIDRFDDRFPIDFDTAAKTTGANASISIPVLQKHSLETGINYRDSETSTEQFTLGSGHENKTDAGVYAQMNWDFYPVTLNTGVRYDQYDVTNNTGANIKGHMASPSIAGKWQVNDNFAVNASWSQAMQTPKLYEALILSLPWADKHSFSDNLTHGKAQTTEVGFEWQGNNGWMADANVFDQRFKDYIATKNTTQENVGELKNRGYEVNVGYKKEGISAYFGMSHSDPKLNGEYYGFALDVMPTGTKYNANVSYQFTDPRLEIGVKNHYVSDYDYKEKVRDKAGNISFIDRHMPNYWVTDIFANWQPLATDNLSINAGINNIADKKYYNHSNFRSSFFTDFTPWNPEKGREFRVGVNYKF